MRVVLGAADQKPLLWCATRTLTSDSLHRGYVLEEEASQCKAGHVEVLLHHGDSGPSHLRLERIGVVITSSRITYESREHASTSFDWWHACANSAVRYEAIPLLIFSSLGIGIAENK